MLNRIVGIIVVAAILAGLLVYSQQRIEPLHVSGFVETHEIRIGSRVGGRVGHVLVKEGDAVQRGQLLVHLEPFQLHELLAQAKSQRNQAQATYDKVKAGFRVEAAAALRKAEKLGRRTAVLYDALGVVDANTGNPASAASAARVRSQSVSKSIRTWGR